MCTAVDNAGVGAPGVEEPGVALQEQLLRGLIVPEHVPPARVQLLARVAPPARSIQSLQYPPDMLCHMSRHTRDGA